MKKEKRHNGFKRTIAFFDKDAFSKNDGPENMWADNFIIKKL